MPVALDEKAECLHALDVQFVLAELPAIWRTPSAGEEDAFGEPAGLVRADNRDDLRSDCIGNHLGIVARVDWLSARARAPRLDLGGAIVAPFGIRVPDEGVGNLYDSADLDGFGHFAPSFIRGERRQRR